MNTKTITAADLRTGDRFTYTGHEYAVVTVTEANDEVHVLCEGQQYEMGFYTDSPVELISRGDGCRCEFQSSLCGACAARALESDRPAVRAVVAPMPVRRRRAPRDYNANLKIVDPKGVLRTINYSTQESMYAGIDRLEAKGWTVWTHC